MATNDDELQGCHEEIQRLTLENQELRQAAECFGDLAERLNRQLQAERRLRTTGNPHFRAQRRSL